jgi:hypothetical protein
METPAPVDLNKLKAILGNAKKVMKAADEKFPKGNKNQGMNESYENYSAPAPMYSESDEREPEYRQYSPSNDVVPQHRDYTSNDIMNSKLPPAIKEAMLKNPIPKPTMGALNSSFSLEGLEDLIEKPAKRPVNPNQFKSPGVPLREAAGGSYQSEQMVTMSVSQLNELIDNRINKALAEMFTKTISEQTIKKTINTLVSEGKITVKKK